MDQLSLFDSTIFDKLLEYGGPPFATHMIDLFMSYVPKKITEARQAMEKGDLVGVKSAVHPIKSSAGTIGAQTMNSLAAHIEQLAIKQNGDDIPRLIADLESTYEAVKACLQEKRTALTTPPSV